MRPNAMLDLATGLLREVLRFDAATDAVVAAFFRRHHDLGPRERHTLAEDVYAVLRRRRLLEHLARGGPGALERRLAILAWPGPEASLHAALTPDERSWLDAARAFDPAALPDALRHNLPDWLAAALRAQLPDDGFWALVRSLDEPAPLDLRVNTLKASRDGVARALAADGVEAVPTRYSPWGLRVVGKPAITRLDAYASGQVEVQDEGSQLLALLVDAKRGEMVVDFCAGSGGKTLALGAAMRNTGRLYAFDVSAHRLDALKPRSARSGLANVHPVQIANERDARIERLAGKIDRVLVDAPCSGLGTLRRNPGLKWRQTPEAVAEAALKQAAILRGAARLVKPGGRLVYATCSPLQAENEAVADAFERDDGFMPLRAADLLARSKVAAAGDLDTGGRLRLWPHRHGTDAFFAAVWQRKA